MAGADYGYVGAAPGKVHIYKATIAVLKNIPEEEAVKELLQLIEKDQKLSPNLSLGGEGLNKTDGN
jgi:(E)-4-hydroxy-3-methylbut-2-enyl-diphosphate synthase